MNFKRVNPLAAAASVGVIALFCTGLTSWTSAHTRVAYQSHPVVHTHVRVSHVTHVRVSDVQSRPRHRPALRAAGRRGYPGVRVNVVVNPALVVSPSYPGPGYLTGSQWYYGAPYPYYPVYLDLTATGYSDGFHRGQDDAEDQRSYDPYRKGFRNPGSVTYTNGFLSGYAAGYTH